MINPFEYLLNLDFFKYPPTYTLYLMLSCFAAFIIFTYLMFPKRRYSHKKRKYIADAEYKLKKLKEIEGFSAQISFIRKAVNPYVFEEMILTALDRKGYKIKRGTRYSHDGGLDGKVVINGHLHFIQAKKYAGYVNPTHISEFIDLCENHGAKGLFVHSGKTGQLSKSILSNTRVKLISGEVLLSLMVDK